MNNKKFRALTASALSAALLCTAAANPIFAVPAVNSGSLSTAYAADSDIVFSTDFEDGDASKFSKRGDSDTSVIKVIEDDKAPSGSKVMSITGRDQSWNGPSLALEGVLEPNVKYDISVKVKAAWYNTVCISLQHTPGGSDQPQYTNLVKGVSQGDYVELTASFAYGAEEKDVSLYIETWGEANDLCVDDFTIKLSPNNMDPKAPSL